MPCVHQDPNISERLAELLYDVGRGHLNKKEYGCAEKWLTRAHEALSEPVIEQSGQDAQELRFCILHGLGVYRVPRLQIQFPNDVLWMLVRAKLTRQVSSDDEILELVATLKRVNSNL